MFKRVQKTMGKEGQPEAFTYIHQDTLLEGSLSAKGRVRVYGVIKGNVTVEGVLEVAEYGVIEGDLVKAHALKVLGRVKASVESTGKVEIWQKGELIGDVRANALDIEEGATFIGRSDMRPTNASGIAIDLQTPALQTSKEDISELKSN